MTARTTGEIYQALRAAGFSRSSAVLMTAVGLGESGGNDTAIGDTALADATWGPSVGVLQERTLKAQTGTGGTRDITWLQGNLDHQAAAAYEISARGTTFAPWTVFTTGAYQQYLPDAERAAASVDQQTGGVYTQVGLGDLGDWVLPPGMTGGLVTAAQAGLMVTVLKITFGLAGIGLAIAGAYLTVQPTVSKVGRQAAQIAVAAGKAAV